jgi:peptidoglycan hydrolase CwlO-like protein
MPPAPPAHIFSAGCRGFLARVVAVVLAVGALLSATASRSAGDLQSQIAAGRSAASSLQAQIAADSAHIQQTTGSLDAAEHRLGALQAQLNEREAQLRAVQSRLLAARNHLVDLENRLRLAASALAANLVANYENAPPDVVSVILESSGFQDLLERIGFLQRIGHQDAQVVRVTRAARAAVTRQVDVLAVLEQRDRALTDQILAQRNQVAALQVALLHERIFELHARRGAAARLGAVDTRVRALEARAAAQAARAAAAAARAAATGTAPVGGLAVDTGAMAQAPAGVPAAVGQVIAAGNAIATLPYVYGGGHGSFRADGYDCSGSVSYALAAAGLVSSPMASGDFESWGDPGPGRWITVYANAGHVWLEVAGRRFDTVALAEGGTRWAQGGGEFAGFVVRHPPGL